MATAVFLDAIEIRSTLMPAVLELLGRRTWAFPTWLDRRLPRLAIEPPEQPAHMPDNPIADQPVMPSRQIRPRAIRPLTTASTTWPTWMPAAGVVPVGVGYGDGDTASKINTPDRSAAPTDL